MDEPSAEPEPEPEPDNWQAMLRNLALDDLVLCQVLFDLLGEKQGGEKDCHGNIPGIRRGLGDILLGPEGLVSVFDSYCYLGPRENGSSDLVPAQETHER